MHSSVFNCSGSHFPIWEKKLPLISFHYYLRNTQKHLFPHILSNFYNFPSIIKNRGVLMWCHAESFTGRIQFNLPAKLLWKNLLFLKIFFDLEKPNIICRLFILIFSTYVIISWQSPLAHFNMSTFLNSKIWFVRNYVIHRSNRKNWSMRF